MQMRPRAALLALICCATMSACVYNPAFEVSCDTEGAHEQGRVCHNGIWIADDADAATGDADDGSVSDGGNHDVGGGNDADMGDSDVGCATESNVEFCDRLGLDCDEVTAPDNCGVERTITCGTCTEPLSCGADGTPNVCSCAAETDLEFCTRLVKTCDDVTDLDNCGIERTVNCGTCTLPATCGGGGTPNVCACPDQTDVEFCTVNNAVCGALTAMDECGQMRTTDCGSCMSPETCGPDTANQCDCPADAMVCTALALECGMADVSASCGNKTMVDCGGCQANAACDGNNTCVCASGYEPDGLGNCVDIDECMTGVAMCDANATCTNSGGGFSCTCKGGYTGDGMTCADIDECATNTDNCDANATCTNSRGSFTCMCNSGYTGSGQMCTDIDECAAGTDNCSANATCTNTPGSFTCMCDPGYTGDGTTCTPNALAVSVQTVHAQLGPGATSDVVMLPTAIVATNAVPFVSLRSTAGDIDVSSVDVDISDTAVTVTRFTNGGGLEVVVAVVEFDPARVAVQKGSFANEGNQTINSVDLTKSFLTFTAAIDRNNDEVDNRMLSGHFADSTTVTFDRHSTQGSIAGHFWVATAKAAEFRVEHLSGSIGNSTTSTALAVPTVDLAKSFVLYSYQTTEGGTSIRNGMANCRLDTATSVGCLRDGSGQQVTDLHVQVVEVTNGAVQRNQTTLNGTTQSGTAGIAPVDLTRAMANLGQTGTSGACKSDETGNGAAPTALGTVDLNTDSEVILQRTGSANGQIECTWEVIEWP